MAIARSMIEEIEENEEEKKESPSPQNNSCLFENNYNDLLEHSSEYLDLLIHESPAKAEIEQGIQILKTDELDTKKMQTIIFLAGEHAPLVADALKTLKNANALNHQYCMAVGKAGPSAPKVAAVLIQLSDMYLLYNRYMSDLYAHFLLLDTDEFIKLSDKIIHAINKMRLNAHKETFLDALHSLIIVKTLRLSECIIDAISVNLTSNTLFYDVVESSEGIADAILLLNKHQMLDQIDNIVKAGKRALKFAHILVNLKKAGLTLSKKLTNKGLIATQNGYLADEIIGAFLDGERLDTFYQLFLLQKEV